MIGFDLNCLTLRRIDFFTEKESNLKPSLEAGREVKGVEGLLLHGGSPELFS